MKISGLLFAVFLAATCCLRAQVTVEVTLDQDQFLAGQSIPATVRITNRSGRTIRLGKDPDWLTFMVESKDGFVVVKKKEVLVEGECALENSKRAKYEVDLAPAFSFTTPGRYAVRATMLTSDWNQEVISPEQPFDIIQGYKMWEQEVGLPQTSGAEGKPVLRRYALHQANYLRKHLMLYVQITEENGTVIKVFPIGRMLSFGQPEPQVDKHSNLHVLNQDGQRTYCYTVIDPRGNVLTKHQYEMAPRPKFKLNNEGNIEVVGGVRRVSPRDIPPPKPVETDAETAKP